MIPGLFQFGSTAARRAALPLLLLLLGGLGSVWLWAQLRRAEREQLNVIVQSAANEAAKSVTARFEAQQAALSHLADLWARAGAAADPNGWLVDTSTLIEHLPEFERLLWIDLRRDAVFATGPDRRAALLDATERQKLAPLLGAARDATSPRLVGPEPGPAGPRYHLIAPARAGGERRGVLVATADVATAFAPVADPLLGRLELLAIWRGLDVFRIGQPQAGAPSRSSRVAVPGDGPLEIQLTAGPTLVRAVIGPAPTYALVAGLLASVLLASLLLANRLAQQRSRELALAHRETAEEAKRAREAERSAFRLAAELEDRVAARTGQLAEAVEELEAFNYSVSHDLRSPLSAIVNFCAIVSDDHGQALGAEGSRLISRIAASAEAAISMMDSLLELSRLGRTRLSVQQVDMEALARETMEQVRIASGSPTVRFELGPLPSAPGDPALLRLVFSNLLSNALKYSREREKPRIAVSGKRSGNELVYSVRDDGVGFDMRYAGRLFRPFQRLHGTADFPGSGVGLAIVARAIRRHDGRVWAQGEPGLGATFSFALPAQRVESDVP